MDRVYVDVISHHIENYKQMVFLAGPRQVGKTTITSLIQAKHRLSYYFNWDVTEHRQQILAGSLSFGKSLALDILRDSKPLLIFDEIHKHSKWKNFLKGFYDLYHDKVHIIVTGSAKLDLHRHANDSLMGRYFLYRIHPLSVAECLHHQAASHELQPPKAISNADEQALSQFGGFPEPFLERDPTFSERWMHLRCEQLFRGDILTLSHIHEIDQLEVLAELLKHQTGQILNRSNLAKKINASVNTVKRWISTLENFYYCFLIKPWSQNISRSLIKEPKLYLWDWSQINNTGARAENIIASHLLKATHFWTDRGLGEFELFFIRDKEKREVDFLVTKNKHPWFLVEVKHASSQSISEHLYRFHKALNTKHAFQVVFDLPYVDKSCFESHEPIIVPATTFLSQLV